MNRHLLLSLSPPSLSLCVCLDYLPICLLVYLSVCLSVYLSACVSSGVFEVCADERIRIMLLASSDKQTSMLLAHPTP